MRKPSPLRRRGGGCMPQARGCPSRATRGQCLRDARENSRQGRCRCPCVPRGALCPRAPWLGGGGGCTRQQGRRTAYPEGGGGVLVGRATSLAVRGCPPQVQAGWGGGGWYDAPLPAAGPVGDGCGASCAPCVAFCRVAISLWGPDSHPFFPSHAASCRCVLSATAACAPTSVVSTFAEPSRWCTGAVLVAAGAVCALALPSSWRTGVVLVAAPPPPAARRAAHAHCSYSCALTVWAASHRVRAAPGASSPAPVVPSGRQGK